ncbi:TonB-dependent receptor [Hymenobacter actinosclerus]|uniref:Iron complex outermembrane recepter protein n=1 Tax=Hymenobacter actinosclerus TaxID=82805 RepID=A0A1I0EQ81_9BACT|nr:TonB-dependent receptor [Hymenobacter actinosclerus]SET47691.1 iron complex outermembrane recepter protein [Hymenobacter actinosclerus]
MPRPLPLLLLLSLPAFVPAAKATPVATTSLSAHHGPDDDTAQKGRVSGLVRDDKGRPVEGVSVALKGTYHGTSTDASGGFRLTAPEGDYQLVVSSLGYTSQELAVRLVAGQTIELPTLTLATSSQALQEVTIEGSRSLNERPVAVGKMPIAPLDLPQSAATVERRVLEQQQVVRLSDALANVNGVYVSGNTGGYQQEISGRGFAYGNSNTFKNGVRYNNSILPETSSLERLEVLKGSAAILYGNVAAGGVLNLVTKKPRFEPGGSVALRAGSYDFYKPMLDVYGAVNGSEHVAFRVNTTYENSRSFRNGVKGERFYVNPSLLFKVGAKTDFLLEGDYLNDNRTPDFGLGAINYRIADVARSRTLNTDWANIATQQKSATATLTHRLSENWQLRGVAAYQGFSSNLRSAARPTTIRDTADIFAGVDKEGNPKKILTGSPALYGNLVRSLQATDISEDYFMGQLDLTGQFRTGFLRHTLLVGVDADKYNTVNVAYNRVEKYDSINVFEPGRFNTRTSQPEFSRNTRTFSPIRRVGVYVQDLIGITDHLKLLAGVRYSYQETGSQQLSYEKGQPKQLGNLSKSYDDAFSPRVGLVYQPLKTMALFASYSNSFNLNSGTDNTNRPLPPTLVDQYELGVKKELLDGRLSANVTAYRIVNGNLAQTILSDAANYNKAYPNAKELAGEVTSRGVELDVQSKPLHGWTVLAGYSYNRTTYTKSNIYTVGSLLRYNPAHTANATAFYTFGQGPLKGLTGGLTALYIGERQAGRSARGNVINEQYRLIKLPSYAQLDASVGYTLDRLSLQVKLSNLLGQLSYNVHDDNSVNPIAPRQFMTTLGYRL